MLIFIIGFLFISIVGTSLHFLYDLSNHNKVVALFAAVNESTWEHIKMALSAYFLWCIFDGVFFLDNPNYFTAKVAGLLTIIISIPLIFYSYKSITKKSILLIDILTFFIAIFLSSVTSFLIINCQNIPIFINYIFLILFFIIFAFYLLLTLLPPKNFLFLDPLTKKYGVDGHK